MQTYNLATSMNKIPKDALWFDAIYNLLSLETIPDESFVLPRTRGSTVPQLWTVCEATMVGRCSGCKKEHGACEMKGINEMGKGQMTTRSRSRPRYPQRSIHGHKEDHHHVQY